MSPDDRDRRLKLNLVSEPAIFPPITGVVLAGGRSTRMGRDKALLTLPNGQTLLEGAIQTLRDGGATEVLVSTRQGQTYAVPGTLEIQDATDNCGPLAGLIAALSAARTDRILVLAVDLPTMPSAYLRRFVGLSIPTCGVVPINNGFFEPLVAVYPRTALLSAHAALNAGQLSLQAWIKDLVVAQLVRPVEVEPAETRLFFNWNRPEDRPASYSP